MFRRIWFITGMSMASWRLRMGVPPVTFSLLVLITAIYLLQLVSAGFLRFPLEEIFGLSVSGAMRGRLWQLLTYQFLHGGPFHLLLNMMMFFFLGAEVERALGRRHFLTLYFLSGVLGGLGWLLLTYPYEGICVGASAAIFGLLSAFAVLYPQREVTLLVMLVFPITLKAWVLALALGCIQLLFTISPGVGGIAYSAHLAGALAGLIYTVAIFRPHLISEFGARFRRSREHRAHVRRAKQQDDEKAEIDRLLDKITREGIHSLSAAERKRLEQVSRARSER